MKKLLASLFAVIALLSSCEKPLAERKELDVDVVDGKFTGYVYNYGFCEEPNYWYRFENYQQRIDTFQIPEENLAKLTTEGLSHTCLYYPLRWDFIAWDGPGALLKLYENFRPDVPEARTMHYRGEISNVNSFMDRNYLELLLSTEYFTPKMSNEQLDRLSGIIVLLTAYYYENPDSHSYFPSFGYPYCALCRVLLVKSSKNKVSLTDIEKSMLVFFIRWSGRVSGVDTIAVFKILSANVPGLKTPQI